MQSDAYGMTKFTSAVMYVLHEVFAMPTHYYIYEPNEVEGRKLLAEMMQGGNFGQYDTRDAALKKGGMMKHGVWKLKNMLAFRGIVSIKMLNPSVFFVDFQTKARYNESFLLSSYRNLDKKYNYGSNS